MISDKPQVIDVLKYISPRNRVFLDNNFRFNLFSEALRNAGTRKTLSKLIDVNETSLYDWKTGRKRPPLDKTFLCGNIAGIDNESVLNNLLAMTAYLVPGSISVDNWKIRMDETMAEWFGLLKGDGSITKYDVRFCNNNLNLIFFFANQIENVFAVPKRRMEIIIRMPEEKNTEELNSIIKKLKSAGFVRISTPSDTNRRFARRKPNLQLRVSSAILSELVSNIQSDMQNTLRMSCNEVKAGYIRGFASAEGCVNVCRGQRSVSFAQKSRETLEFISSLLSELGIRAGNCKQSTNILQTYITTRKEIEKFRSFVGFGHHNVKNRKLDDILAGYDQGLPYKTSKSERYADIMRVIGSNNLTCKEISATLNLKCHYTNKLLNEMLEQNMVRADKSNKTFTYRSAKMRAELEEEVGKVSG